MVRCREATHGVRIDRQCSVECEVSRLEYDFRFDRSTANAGAAKAPKTAPLSMLSNSGMNPLFDATVQAVEEAIVNALVAAETMTGRDGRRVVALPHGPLRQVLKQYGRLAGDR